MIWFDLIWFDLIWFDLLYCTNWWFNLSIILGPDKDNDEEDTHDRCEKQDETPKDGNDGNAQKDEFLNIKGTFDVTFN